MNTATNTIEMTQLSLFGIDPVNEPILDPRGKHLINGSGRPLGSLGVATPTRLREVARLAVQGYKSGEIARELKITVVRASQLMKQAEQENISVELNEARDEFTRNMEDRLRSIAEDSVTIIQARLDNIQEDLNNSEVKDADALDARAMNDAFRAFDKTELGVRNSRNNGNDKNSTNIIAIFGNDALEKAKEVSNRINVFGVE